MACLVPVTYTEKTYLSTIDNLIPLPILILIHRGCKKELKDFIDQVIIMLIFMLFCCNSFAMLHSDFG